MSPDKTPNLPQTRNTREMVRERAQVVNARQKRARWMRRIIVGLVAVVVVGAAGGAVATVVVGQISKPTLTPQGMSDDGVVVQGVTVTSVVGEPLVAAAPLSGDAPISEGAAEAPIAPESTTSAQGSVEAVAGAVDIRIYADYLSPGTGEFQRTNVRQLTNWISINAATVSYHPVALLTANSNGTRYSLRAAAAAACVATYAPDRFFLFNNGLLSNQPKVDTDGRSDAELASLAVASGAGEEQVTTCIEDQDFVSWAKEATARALEGPLPDTDSVSLISAPMVLVNGHVYVGALNDPAEFAQFVLTVASDKSATPTPTPSP